VFSAMIPPMRKIAIACSALALAASLAAAGCGSSDSSSTTTTAASTTAAGRMGALNAERCTPPRINGTTFLSFSATGVSCDTATPLLKTFYSSNKVPGWTCSHRISGRNTSVTCTQDGNTGNTFSSTWTVS
jgi:hypothetical protein